MNEIIEAFVKPIELTNRNISHISKGESVTQIK